MNRRTQLLDYMSGLYVPKSKNNEFSQLVKIVCENDYRPINENDSGKMFRDCLIIETKGRGLYETYQSHKICRIDVGEVGGSMANVAIYENDISPVKPMKINKGNIRINLPNE